jgi:predicted nucleic acid-binding protein
LILISLIYAYDNSAGDKQIIASEIIDELWSSGFSIVSTQVLQEFFVNVTKKIPKPLDIGSLVIPVVILYIVMTR